MTTSGCDLLSKLYLWYMKYNSQNLSQLFILVVICFQNCTFGIWNTTIRFISIEIRLLWFAFKIVPLVYEIQPCRRRPCRPPSCDLLSKLYLWYMKYNMLSRLVADGRVVICFQNCTFGIWNTTIKRKEVVSSCCDLLSKLYLWYMKYNLKSSNRTFSPVVICFQNCTFGIWNTTPYDMNDFPACCDLLSKLYLWYMKYNNYPRQYDKGQVVICFQNCTFGIWNTTGQSYRIKIMKLWFAFKIVPLVYEIQQAEYWNAVKQCCDLLSKLYLWYMKYNHESFQNFA